MAYRTTSWKNTDIGKIPSDWNLVKLGEHCKMFSGGTPSVGKTEYYGGDIPFIRSGEIHDSKTELVITEVGLRSSSAKLVKKGDILYALYGATSGDVSLSNIEGAINQAILCIRPDKILLPKYLVDSLCKEKENIVNTYLQGGQGNLSGQIVKNIILSIPQMPEQQKIATVLTDLDDLIAELENVRDKKQAIKIGAMQELLTGKRRLPGFNKPWKEVELGEMVFNHKIFIGKGQTLTSKQLKAGSIPVIAGGKTVPYTNSEYNYDKPCVTISASGAYAGYVWYHKGKIWASDCNVVYGINGYNTEFLSYILKFNQKKLYANQIGGAQPHVYASDIKILTVPDISETEQTAIANILSDMDDEISAINDKINKYKQIKAGVADELLSGRIRLIKPQE